jgi:DNA (cytosine-5)-methyltransferase 1
MNYYNDNDPHAAAWLKELMAEGLISAGDIDDRPIQEVQVEDLRGYTRIHLFAGIGGWDRALNLAGWGDRQILTASLPCQPFSTAGSHKSICDDRHLWPIVRELIEGLNPPFIIGEQVASAEVVGTQQEAAFLKSVQSGDYARANKLAKRLAQSKSFHYWPRWVDGIQSDLEKAGYAFRFMVLGAHSLGAPHIRQRLWWMANIHSRRCNGQSVCLQPREARQDHSEVAGRSDDCGLADTESQHDGAGESRPAGWEKLTDSSVCSGLADSIKPGLEGHAEDGDGGNEPGRLNQEKVRPIAEGCWADSIWWPCRDGKYRRIPARWVEPAGKWEIEPPLFPLDDGLPGRVGLLRGTGNAIVPQVAAEFIQSAYEYNNEREEQ